MYGDIIPIRLYTSDRSTGRVERTKRFGAIVAYETIRFIGKRVKEGRSITSPFPGNVPKPLIFFYLETIGL